MAGKSTGGIRKPYVGDRRSLVVALDVGTTFSGVSYAFLNPGEVPKIHGVTRYPGQEHVTGNTKIPSILYYDRDGVVKAAGAEAEGAQIEALAEDEEWTKVELFKLRLRPKQMELDMNGMKMTPLPAKKSSESVFGDFLRYLFSCSRKFIEDTHANGKNLWMAVEKDIHFVLSHPNGWEGAQQSRMRRAAIFGGLVPDTDEGKSRIRFVTEGEASMHACILSGLAADVLATGNGFIVADAGGGTLDISSYVLRGTHPLIIEEVAPPDCLFAGSVFVSRRARVFLEEKLKGSKYGSPDSLDHVTKRFDETTKRLFRDKNDPQYIHFGSPLDKDQKVGIRGGQLKLTGAEVAELFEPSIHSAVASIIKQFEASRGIVKAVWLVGGFAASSWLFSQLQTRLAHLNIVVNRPDTQTSKAVADGAIGFFCDHHVSARISRFMYGVEFLREINMQDQEHVSRQGRMLRLPSGPQYLPDAFDCILKKSVRVKESSVFSRKYYTEVTNLASLSVFEIEIWCYRGGEEIPKWIERDSPQFGSLCFVRADLSKITNAAEPQKGPNGQTYWTIVFSIEIHFGLTEFKARMKYTEDGAVKYGPASIVFNEKGHRNDEDDKKSIPDDENVAKPRSRHSKAPKTSSSSRSSSSRSDATTVEPIMIDPPSPSSTSSKGKSKKVDDKKSSSPLSSPIASRAGSEHGIARSLDAAAIDIVIPSKTPSNTSNSAPSKAASATGALAPQPGGSSLAPSPALSSSASGQSSSPKPSPTDTLVNTPRSPMIAAASSVKGDPPAVVEVKVEAKADDKTPEAKELPPTPAGAEGTKGGDVVPQVAKSDAKVETKSDAAPAISKAPSSSEKNTPPTPPSVPPATGDAKADEKPSKSETPSEAKEPVKQESDSSPPKVDDKLAPAPDASAPKVASEAAAPPSETKATPADAPPAPPADPKVNDAPATSVADSKPGETASSTAGAGNKPAETPAADAKADAKPSETPAAPAESAKPAETPSSAPSPPAADAKPTEPPATIASDAKPSESPAASAPDNKPAETPAASAAPSVTAPEVKPAEAAVVENATKPDDKPTTDVKATDAPAATPSKSESTPAAEEKPKEEKVDTPAKAATEPPASDDKSGKGDTPTTAAPSEKSKEEPAVASTSDKPKENSTAKAGTPSLSKDEKKDANGPLPTPPSNGGTEEKETGKGKGKGKKGKGKGNNKGPTPSKGGGNTPSAISLASSKSGDNDSKEKDKVEDKKDSGVWGSESPAWGSSLVSNAWT